MAGLKNTLSLHEAIAVGFINLNKESFRATFDKISIYNKT